MPEFKYAVLPFLGIIFLYSQSGHAESKRLSGGDLKQFDFKEIAIKEDACRQARSKKNVYEEWLSIELKSAGLEDFMLETTLGRRWDASVVEFKVADQDMPAEWSPGSPGTVGVINGKKIEADENHKGLVAEIIDVGRGSEKELQSLKGLENKIWLVEGTNLIPDPKVLTFEAKLRKAVALIIYQMDVKPFDFVITPVMAALPMVTVNQATALKIKNALKKGSVEVNMTVHTIFPVETASDRVLINSREQIAPVILSASSENCTEVASMLEFFSWIKKLQISLNLTSFVISTERTDIFLRHPLWVRNHAQNLNLKNLDEKNYQEFLKNWFKLDHSKDSTKHLGLTSLEAVAKVLKGIVDGSELEKFHLKIKKFDNSGFIKKHNLLARLEELAPSQSVSDLHVLQQLHSEVQRGQWDKAKLTCKSLSGFEWINFVSPLAFSNYVTVSDNSFRSRVDPKVWVLLSGGRENLDEVLVLIENEIDRLGRVVTEEYIEIKKGVEAG